MFERSEFPAITAKGFFSDDLSFEEFTSTLDNPNGIISSDKVGASIMIGTPIMVNATLASRKKKAAKK